MTHLPYFVEKSIALIAGGPCPWPNEIMLISSVFLPFYLAILSKFWRGSAPTDNTNVSGILFMVSMNIYCIVGELEFVKD